jgi:hypothetical protein
MLCGEACEVGKWNRLPLALIEGPLAVHCD